MVKIGVGGGGGWSTAQAMPLSGLPIPRTASATDLNEWFLNPIKSKDSFDNEMKNNNKTNLFV